MKHFYKDPLSGSVYSGTINDIVANVMRVRSRQGLNADRPSIYNDVLKHIQTKNVRVARNKRQKVRFKDAMAAGKAAIKIVSGDTVNDAEIKRRWEICAGCPGKSETAECFSCNRAKFLAQITNSTRALFGSDIKYPGESKKFSCGVCGCSLVMLLPTKSENLHEDTPEQKEIRPDFCWMNPESPNYKK